MPQTDSRLLRGSSVGPLNCHRCRFGLSYSPLGLAFCFPPVCNQKGSGSFATPWENSRNPIHNYCIATVVGSDKIKQHTATHPIKPEKMKMKNGEGGPVSPRCTGFVRPIIRFGNGKQDCENPTPPSGTLRILMVAVHTVRQAVLLGERPSLHEWVAVADAG